MMWPIPDDEPDHVDRQRPGQRITRDVRLALLVGEELAADLRFGDQPIAVELQNGVVVLTGTVDTPDTRTLLGDAARRVDGVTDVCNTLRIAPLPQWPAGGESSDPAAERTVDQQFQDIVADLSATDTLSPRGAAADRRIRTFLGIISVISWISLTVLVAWLSAGSAFSRLF